MSKGQFYALYFFTPLMQIISIKRFLLNTLYTLHKVNNKTYVWKVPLVFLQKYATFGNTFSKLILLPSYETRLSSNQELCDCYFWKDYNDITCLEKLQPSEVFTFFFAVFCFPSIPLPPHIASFGFFISLLLRGIFLFLLIFCVHCKGPSIGCHVSKTDYYLWINHLHGCFNVGNWRIVRVTLNL